MPTAHFLAQRTDAAAVQLIDAAVVQLVDAAVPLADLLARGGRVLGGRDSLTTFLFHVRKAAKFKNLFLL